MSGTIPGTVVIVGAGHGGSQAAVSLRDRGFEGSIHLVSDERELPYHRPPLSKSFLLSPQATLQPLRSETSYRDNRVELHLGGAVRAIDMRGRRVTLSDGGGIQFDHLIVATGARARLPELSGIRLPQVNTLQLARDASQIRERLQPMSRVVIVGGGFVGLEIAATAAKLACQVTIVETAGRFMARAVSEIVSAHFHELHRALGSAVRFGTGLTSIGNGSGAAIATLSDGTMHEADLIIIGVGAAPNVEIAEAAGLPVNDGILVDRALRTANAAVSAIGDVARLIDENSPQGIRLECVQNAVDQAKAVAGNLTGVPTPYGAVPWFWSDQAGLKLQIAGIVPAGSVQPVLRGDPTTGSFSVFHFVRDRLAAVESINRGSDHVAARRLLENASWLTRGQARDEEFDLRRLVAKATFD